MLDKRAKNIVILFHLTGGNTFCQRLGSLCCYTIPQSLDARIDPESSNKSHSPGTCKPVVVRENQFSWAWSEKKNQRSREKADTGEFIPFKHLQTTR